MGAERFEVRMSGAVAEWAFREAVDRAQYDHGHRGYTGTIAEKQAFLLVVPERGETPEACLQRCSNDSQHFSDNKWGPAACIDLGPDPKDPTLRVFVFFGWASS